MGVDGDETAGKLKGRLMKNKEDATREPDGSGGDVTKGKSIDGPVVVDGRSARDVLRDSASKVKPEPEPGDGRLSIRMGRKRDPADEDARLAGVRRSLSATGGTYEDGLREDEIIARTDEAGDSPPPPSSEIVDPATKERVQRIVRSITERAVVGKWEKGATYPSVGDLPAIVIPPGKSRLDYDQYGGTKLPGIGVIKFIDDARSYIDDYHWRYKRFPDGLPRHIISRIAFLGPDYHLIDYFTYVTSKDSTGRDVTFIHHLYKVPKSSGEDLITLISENPDAAEEFYRQATGSTENDGNIPGEERSRSSQIGIFDSRQFRDLQEDDDPLVSGKFERGFNNFVRATTKKDYVQPYGER